MNIEKYKQKSETDCFGHFGDNKCKIDRFYCDREWNCSILTHKIEDGKASISEFALKEQAVKE